jgi:hypothetical protein
VSAKGKLSKESHDFKDSKTEVMGMLESKERNEGARGRCPQVKESGSQLKWIEQT